jgi:hypothetical protein
MQRLERIKVEMLATPDQQISLTDPDARSMATSGRGSAHSRSACHSMGMCGEACIGTNSH